MGELARLLERIDAEATTPDGQIRARLSGRMQLALEFRPRAYGSCADAELGRRLSRIATMLWVRYHREYVEVENSFLGFPEPDPDPEDRRFEQEAEELTVSASSPGGWVTMTSRALAFWTVDLAAGTQRSLAQDRFVTEVLAAGSATITAYRSARMRLLDRYYDLADGLPPWRRSGPAGRPTGERW
ncbi:hypothetical protein [Actinoplanes philippinensis]|uniref:hypothetical protein n=1 Tax=Actinoplanes philippinensis TaxID=35752 RepID=UPI003405CE21